MGAILSDVCTASLLLMFCLCSVCLLLWPALLRCTSQAGHPNITMALLRAPSHPQA
jgi:hypothetical protein